MTLWKVLAVVLAWNALCWSVVGALVAPVVTGGLATVAGVAALTLLPLVAIARSIGSGRYPSAAMRLVVFRFFWYAQLLLPLVAIAGLLGALAGLIAGAPGAFGRAAMAAIAIVYLVLIVWGYAGSRRLRIRHLELPFGDLPDGLHGLSITQLSDLHVGPHTPKRHLARIGEAVRRAAADIIVVTGDQVDDYARDVEHFGAAFADLAAPLGVYVIAGNHDVYAGWTEVRRGLEQLGYTVLVNDAVRIERDGASFWLAGTGDPAGRDWPRGGGEQAAPDIERTLRDVPRDAFTIALAHNPALWPRLADEGVELTLSGHTHYGQFAIPRLGWSLASPFLEHAMEMHRRGRSTLYINPGTNFWGIPFRIGTPPEVTVIRLVRSTGNPDLDRPTPLARE
jgi:predicted MPP superfamily phosphohydrolase